MKLRPASPRNEILATLGRFRPALRSVALFTAVINLLMLAPSLYMLQVYDRVLGSGNHMTLLMLTLMVLGLYLLLGALEWVRSLVVIRLGGQLDMQLNQRIYDASFRASLERGEQAVGQALNDLTSLRQFLTGNALFAFFDAPWFPLYLLVIFLFSPWLGLLAWLGRCCWCCSPGSTKAARANRWPRPGNCRSSPPSRPRPTCARRKPWRQWACCRPCARAGSPSTRPSLPGRTSAASAARRSARPPRACAWPCSRWCSVSAPGWRWKA